MKHLLTCMGSELVLLVPLFLHNLCTDADVSQQEKKNRTLLQIQAKIHAHSKSEVYILLFQLRLPQNAPKKSYLHSSVPAVRCA